MKLSVEGRVGTSAKAALDTGMFNACVMIGGKVAGQAQVTGDGEYQIDFEAEETPEVLELKIVPASMSPEAAGGMALSRKFNSSRLVPSEGDGSRFVLPEKLYLPVDFLDLIRRRTRTYHVHGTVYLEHPTYFSFLPGCRIDFFEVDYLDERPLPTHSGIIRRQDFLGSAYTRADGTYDFNFKFGAFPTKPGYHLFPEIEIGPLVPGPKLPGLRLDYKPDIRARFYLFINGVWTNIFNAPMTDFDWNIDPDYHRDYRIPAETAIGAVDPGTKPATGFKFKTIGLLPIDNTRIVDGYAHTFPGDPITGITHEPFCGTLRIYGLFAPAPAVTTYSVEILKTDSTGTASPGETWKPLGAPLTNLQWNDATHRWDAKNLGIADEKYRNIDIEDAMEWLEPALKAVWNTANSVNGYYKLRVTGYDATNTAVATEEVPMLRIDNDLPQADLDVLSPSATVCGDLTLGGDRKITFRVTAYEADGHLHSYSLSGSRGRYGETAGPDVSHGRTVVNANWAGVINAPEEYAVAVRSTSTITCATMAYSFHLKVQGAGTNGYANCLESKRVWRTNNLVVTE